MKMKTAADLMTVEIKLDTYATSVVNSSMGMIARVLYWQNYSICQHALTMEVIQVNCLHCVGSIFYLGLNGKHNSLHVYFCSIA